MDVTKKNFHELMPELEDGIDTASFISIDCEFTGVSTERNLYPFDYLEDYFRKTCENSSGYILIQLGLTLVRPIVSGAKSNTENNADVKSSTHIDDKKTDAKGPTSENAKFQYKTYNFYVFPKSWRNSFRCQGTSLSFLAENGFNFSKLFSEGIPYCNRKEEEELRAQLQEKELIKDLEEKKRADNEDGSLNHIPVPEEEKEFMDNIRKTVEEFILSDDKEKVIENINAFQRKLVYQLIEAQFNDKVNAFTKCSENNRKILSIEKRKSPEEEEKEKGERQKKEIENNVGISLILKKLSESKKLIIGHNMLLDLIFILRQFFEPIDGDLKEFKKLVFDIFPYIVDTKYLATLKNFKQHIKNSTLLPLVQTLSKYPFGLPEMESENKDFNYSVERDQSHDAGYDSYLTALAFLGMMKFLNIPLKNISSESVEVKDYINRLHVMRISDIDYINLQGHEEIPPRDYVFHTTFPDTWTQSDVVKRFKRFGVISFWWINSQSAFIVLQEHDKSHLVLKTISQSNGFKVQSYNSFRKIERKDVHRVNLSKVEETKNSGQKRKHEPEYGFHAKKLIKNDGSKMPSNGDDDQREKCKSNEKKHFKEDDDWS